MRLGRVIKRQPGRPNLPNRVEIIDPDFRACRGTSWMAYFEREPPNVPPAREWGWSRFRR
jgi:hypothetical protein